MTNLYEGMFLLDNDVVREDWGKAKALVTDTLSKHGAELKTARRWDERKLAYPIKKRRRATYLLCYFEAPGGAITPAGREFDIREGVLRYLMLRSDEIPAEEFELSQAELADDFSVPEPPADDAPDVEETPEEDAKDEKSEEESTSEGDEKPESEGDEKASEGADGEKASAEKGESSSEKAADETPEKKTEES